MHLLAVLTPDGVAPIAAALVVLAAFFTAALTAAFGLGGGLALLAVMSALFPAGAVIPVHGVAQLGANSSRFVFQRRNVVWTVALWFVLGGLIGTAIGARLYIGLPAPILKAAVGAFVLYTVWGPKPKGFAPGRKTFFTTGAVAAFLTMFFGATGPIAASMLGATKLDRLQIVATHAACMVAQHAMKTIAFGFLGFAYAAWGPLIFLVVFSGFLGSWAGTRLLRAMPEKQFRAGFRAVLTFFGVYLLAVAALAGVKTS